MGLGFKDRLKRRISESGILKMGLTAGAVGGLNAIKNIGQKGLTSNVETDLDSATDPLGELLLSESIIGDRSRILRTFADKYGVEGSVPRTIFAKSNLSNMFLPGPNVVVTGENLNSSAFAHELGHFADIKGNSGFLRTMNTLGMTAPAVGGALTLASLPVAFVQDRKLRDRLLGGISIAAGAANIPRLIAEGSASLKGLSLLKELNNGTIPQGAIANLGRAYGTYLLQAGVNVAAPLAVRSVARKIDKWRDVHRPEGFNPRYDKNAAWINPVTIAGVLGAAMAGVAGYEFLKDRYGNVPIQPVAAVHPITPQAYYGMGLGGLAGLGLGYGAGGVTGALKGAAIGTAAGGLGGQYLMPYLINQATWTPGSYL